MTSAKISDFLTPPSPLVRKFTQPPLLKLLTMSAFEGTPSPLSADVICEWPPTLLSERHKKPSSTEIAACQRGCFRAPEGAGHGLKQRL